jgi:hypothetical protein
LPSPFRCRLETRCCRYACWLQPSSTFSLRTAVTEHLPLVPGHRRISRYEIGTKSTWSASGNPDSDHYKGLFRNAAEAPLSLFAEPLYIGILKVRPRMQMLVPWRSVGFMSGSEGSSVMDLT